MGEKRQARRPLLYIQQPAIRAPEAQMQQQYSSPKKPKVKSGQDTPKRPFKHSDFNNKNGGVAGTEDLADDDYEYDDAAEDSEGQGRKKFRDLTLRERVDYFIDTPKHLPAMKCEVTTDEKKYRGLIVGFEDEMVLMRVGRRVNPIKLPFETVEDIRLIGF